MLHARTKVFVAFAFHLSFLCYHCRRAITAMPSQQRSPCSSAGSFGCDSSAAAATALHVCGDQGCAAAGRNTLQLEGQHTSECEGHSGPSGQQHRLARGQVRKHKLLMPSAATAAARATTAKPEAAAAAAGAARAAATSAASAAEQQQQMTADTGLAGRTRTAWGMDHLIPLCTSSSHASRMHSCHSRQRGWQQQQQLQHACAPFQCCQSLLAKANRSLPSAPRIHAHYWLVWEC